VLIRNNHPLIRGLQLNGSDNAAQFNTRIAASLASNIENNEDAVNKFVALASKYVPLSSNTVFNFDGVLISVFHLVFYSYRNVIGNYPPTLKQVKRVVFMTLVCLLKSIQANNAPFALHISRLLFDDLNSDSQNFWCALKQSKTDESQAYSAALDSLINYLPSIKQLDLGESGNEILSLAKRLYVLLVAFPSEMATKAHSLLKAFFKHHFVTTTQLFFFLSDFWVEDCIVNMPSQLPTLVQTRSLALFSSGFTAMLSAETNIDSVAIREADFNYFLSSMFVPLLNSQVEIRLGALSVVNNMVDYLNRVTSYASTNSKLLLSAIQFGKEEIAATNSYLPILMSSLLRAINAHANAKQAPKLLDSLTVEQSYSVQDFVLSLAHINNSAQTFLSERQLTIQYSLLTSLSLVENKKKLLATIPLLKRLFSKSDIRRSLLFNL